MNRYGDTPLGMVESALEFARIARDHGYHNFMFSMKASNPKVMIEAYRLLVARLAAEGPTGTIRSTSASPRPATARMAASRAPSASARLLCDGIGDTIRVSLTEDTVYEIPVARALVKASPPKQADCRLSRDQWSLQL